MVVPTNGLSIRYVVGITVFKISIKTSQNNFMRQIRNFIVDISLANMFEVAGIHWQVAQATSLQNIFFFQSTDAAKTQMGVCKHDISVIHDIR